MHQVMAYILYCDEQKIFWQILAAGIQICLVIPSAPFHADTSDFFALNHYSTSLVTDIETPADIVSYYNDQEVQESQDPSWTRYIKLFYLRSSVSFALYKY